MFEASVELKPDLKQWWGVSSGLTVTDERVCTWFISSSEKISAVFTIIDGRGGTWFSVINGRHYWL